MRPIEFHTQIILDVAAWAVVIGCVMRYLLIAWNQSSLPVQVARMLRLKDSQSLFTRDDWQTWSHVRLPQFLAQLLNCPICQAPYLALALYGILALSGLASPTVAALAMFPGIVIALYRSNKPTPFNPSAAAMVADYKTELRGQVAEQRELQKAQAEAQVRAVHSSSAAKSPISARYGEFVDRFNLQPTIGADGSLVVDPASITDEFRQALRFFSMEEPCWFEGCEDLRKAYTQELQTFPETCKDCRQSDLNRKYLLLVANAQTMVAATPP